MWQQYELCVISIVLQVKTRDRQVLNNAPKVLPLLIDKISLWRSGSGLFMSVLCVLPIDDVVTLD